MQTPRSPPIASSRIALVDRDNPQGSQVRKRLAAGGRRIRTLGPRKRVPLFKCAHQWQRAADNELCDRRNDQVLDAAKFEQEDGVNEAGFGGIAPKNCWK